MSTIININWDGRFYDDLLGMLLEQFDAEIDTFHQKWTYEYWKDIGQGSVDGALERVEARTEHFRNNLKLLDALYEKVVDWLEEGVDKEAVPAGNATWAFNWMAEDEFSVLQHQHTDDELPSVEKGLVEALWDRIELAKGEDIPESLPLMISQLQECLAELDVICDTARRLKAEKDQALAAEKE